MIARYKSRGVVWSVAGIILQLLGTAGIFSQAEATAEMNPKFAAVCFIIMGTALLSFGLAWYARAKGRQNLWAATGVLSLFGFILVYLLKDKTTGKKRKR